MAWNARIGQLQFLTMDEGPIGHLEQIEAACQAGIRWIQLRMKQVSEDQYLYTAREAKTICDRWDCALIINDRVAVAKEIKAYGVHLGKEDMPVGEAREELGKDFIIGGTANTAEDVLAHCIDGADYIGLGPYRYTTTKKKLSPVLGLEGYRRIMDKLKEEQVSIPVVAIGGLLMEDMKGLMQAGVYGAAFSGLLVHAADRQEIVGALKQQFSSI
jgi:thiamine-phosphate pyrophosphorylase